MTSFLFSMLLYTDYKRPFCDDNHKENLKQMNSRCVSDCVSFKMRLTKALEMLIRLDYISCLYGGVLTAWEISQSLDWYLLQMPLHKQYNMRYLLKIVSCNV